MSQHKVSHYFIDRLFEVGFFKVKNNAEGRKKNENKINLEIFDVRVLQ